MPLTVLAGFLGSGKTTLVNRILAGAHGIRVAVLVNDFGSLDIDGRLIASREANVITLENGCVCCTVRADLVAQLTALVESASAPQHVLIETSGLSDPGRLLVALRDPHLRTLTRLDGVITLVDAAAIGSVPPSAQELARRQLANADLIVFNKTDLVSPAALAALRERIVFPRARIVEARHGDVPHELLLGVSRPESDAPAGAAVPDDHTAGIATWTWTSVRPLAYEAVRDLLATLPPGVFRAKGFLHLLEAPEDRVVAHVVGRRVDLRPLGGWGGARPRSELVFVSLDGELDVSALRQRLAATAQPTGSGSSRPDV